MPGGNIEIDESPCAVTGLSSSQKRAIESSWDLVTADAETNGMELFIRLFQEYPKTKQHFSKLRDVPLDDLRNNTTLINHSQKAIGAVTHLVDHLEDPHEIVRSVQELARDHNDMGVTVSDFKVVLSVLQSLMKDALKEKYNICTEQAWQTCCDVISSVAEAEMNKKT